jgi:hypothetical protein
VGTITGAARQLQTFKSDILNKVLSTLHINTTVLSITVSKRCDTGLPAG